MIRVEDATPEMFEQVEPLLALFHNPKITRDQWRSLFHYPWTAQSALRGFVLRDEERVVGFFGTVWSDRLIDGERERICNLTSWITLPEVRNQSLLLLKAVMALQDCTITCHSPATQLYPLYKRFGFQDLETKLRIILPWPSAPSLLSWREYRITTCPVKIATRLSPADRTIFEAHRLPGCGHLLVHGKRDYCYIVFTKTKGKRYHFAHIHYLSDREVFRANIDRIKWRLFLAAGTPLVMVDSRFLGDLALPHSRTVPLAVPHVYRSSRLQPEQIDNLYSELLLLGL